MPNLTKREIVTEVYRKSGWKAFDPNATPYNADQVQKERSLYMK